MKPKKQDPTTTVKQCEQAIWNVLKDILDVVAIFILFLFVIAIIVSGIYLCCLMFDNYIDNKFDKHLNKDHVAIYNDKTKYVESNCSVCGYITLEDIYIDKDATKFSWSDNDVYYRNEGIKSGWAYGGTTTLPNDFEDMYIDSIKNR